MDDGLLVHLNVYISLIHQKTVFEIVQKSSVGFTKESFPLDMMVMLKPAIDGGHVRMS